ncbi:methyl-accepting chemotaxis protein [Pulveribacter suum]|uniref:Chemotaxis protein n=1 Tax=Pulveribacter suum TaxID=2116657 RepID=A0A2P1NLZ8_9BURK|nr:methyl-accepting chemotaxis protein [Pulveribacter suum]AVP58081.1 chemotaxis protein [Pulveribacter suum]
MQLLKTLKGQVLLIAALCLAAGLAALTAATYFSSRAEAQDALAAQSRALARSHADGLRDWVRSKAAIVAVAGTASANPEPEAILARLKTAGGYLTAYFGYADKRTAFSSPQSLPADYDPTSRPWYQQAAASQSYILTRPYEDAGGHGLVLTIAQAVRAGTQVQAVAAGDISIDTVVKNVATIKPTPSSYAFLLAGDGALIAHPDAQLALQPSTALAPELTAAALQQIAQRGQLQPVRLQGRPMLLTVVPVEGTDWLLAVAADEHEAQQGIRTLLRTSLLAGLAVLVLALLALAAILSWRLRRLTLVRDAMHEIGEGDGDLSRRIDAQGEDELAQIARSFNTFAAKLAGVLAQIRDASQSVRLASEEIAVGNQDLSSRTELAASSLQQTAASMQQLTETVRHTADAARQADQLVAQASGVAQHGGRVVGDVVSTMEQIDTASRKISDIIGVIDSIAFQTNILALNAAVEAARAGEQGRGFAVVAGEVRQLASRSAEAAREIKALIGSSVQQVQTGSRLVADAGTTMSDIVQSVQRVTDIMGEITSAATEQSTSIAEVGQAVSQLDQMTQQNAALVEQSAAAAASLKDQSARLSEVVGSFRLQGDGAAQPARPGRPPAPAALTMRDDPGL